MWRKTVQFYWLKSVYFILPFTGRPTFSTGVTVTLYLNRLDSGMGDVKLPEQLMPAQFVLGVEKDG